MATRPVAWAAWTSESRPSLNRNTQGSSPYGEEPCALSARVGTAALMSESDATGQYPAGQEPQGPETATTDELPLAEWIERGGASPLPPTQDVISQANR